MSSPNPLMVIFCQLGSALQEKVLCSSESESKLGLETPYRQNRTAEGTPVAWYSHLDDVPRSDAYQMLRRAFSRCTKIEDWCFSHSVVDSLDSGPRIF